MTNITNFETRCEILSDFWLGYSGNNSFSEFFAKNDLIPTLAFGIFTKLVSPTEKVKPLVDNAFDNLLELFSKTDTGYNSLDDILGLESLE